MAKKPHWSWSLYLIFYVFVKTIFAIYFFRQDTPSHLYYQILIAYHLRYLLLYCQNALSVILNTLSIWPLYLFIRRVYILAPGFWKGFFFLRLLLDVTSHSYEVKFLQSLFHQDAVLTVQIILALMLFSLPSYAALFMYAFRERRAA